MDDHGSVESQSASLAVTAAGPPTIRAGIVAAALWLVIGLTAAWLSAQAGRPAQSAGLAMLAGAVALLIAGWRYKLPRINDWIGAGVVEVLVVVGMGSVVLFMWTMASFRSDIYIPPSISGATESSPPIRTARQSQRSRPSCHVPWTHQT